MSVNFYYIMLLIMTITVTVGWLIITFGEVSRHNWILLDIVLTFLLAFIVATWILLPSHIQRTFNYSQPLIDIDGGRE